MSETQEALAPQDAPVSPPEAQPDGTEQKAENAAESSPAAASKTSDSIEPEAKRLSERFAELTRLRRDAERDRDHWRDLASRQYKPPEPQAPLQTEKAKTLADFNFDEAQHQAYIFQQSAKAATEAAKRELKAEQETQRKQKDLADYVGRVKEFAKDKADFNDVAESARISDQIAEMVVRSEQGPELAYHLGKNPDVATSLSALPPSIAAYELGMLAARLKFDREIAAKAKTSLSQAPPPAPRIEATGDGTPKAKPDDPDSDKLSDAEWVKRRNAQVAARQRRG
jgi:hypothetical protein